MIWGCLPLGLYGDYLGEPSRVIQISLVISSRDPCDTPQFWQMIRDWADHVPRISEWGWDVYQRPVILR